MMRRVTLTKVFVNKWMVVVFSAIYEQLHVISLVALFVYFFPESKFMALVSKVEPGWKRIGHVFDIPILFRLSFDV